MSINRIFLHLFNCWLSFWLILFACSEFQHVDVSVDVDQKIKFEL
jgi:hypothetical protein